MSLCVESGCARLPVERVVSRKTTSGMYRFIPAAVAGIAVPMFAGAQSSPIASDTTPKITFGGFVDGYYAYDFNRPSTFDRAFTTQPARHNEFNVNLAHVDVKLDGRRIRGRFALQAGTSVQSNYAGEPRNGSVGGPELSRHIQEAVVGAKLADALWLDGGIFLSHIGMESFISRDNPTYTRSLVADYSPYYQSGVKLTWQASPTITAQLNVVNGWQIISESNSAKSTGVRIDYTRSSRTVFSYYNYLGDEAADSVAGRRLRFFNGVGVKSSLTSRFQFLANLDYGIQEGGEVSGSAIWHGGVLIGRFQATPAVAVVARVERYDDEDQVLISTGLADGFRVTGGSLGIDVTPATRLLWRSELRGFQGDRAVFPKRDSSPSRGNGFVVSSLALTF